MLSTAHTCFRGKMDEQHHYASLVVIMHWVCLLFSLLVIAADI